MKHQEPLFKMIYSLVRITGLMYISVLLATRVPAAQAGMPSADASWTSTAPSASQASAPSISPALAGDPNLVAYWKMDQVSGGTIVDSSGHGYDLRLVPSPTLPTLSTTDTPLLTGGNGGSLAFNGSESFAYAWPLTQLATSQQSTLEAWVKFDSLDVAGVLSVGKLTLVPDPSARELQILYPYLAGARTTGANLQVGQWIHLAVVFDTSQSTNAERFKVFVNGVPLSLSYNGGPLNRATPTLPSDPVRLGYLPTDNAISLSNFYPLQGKLDEVRIYNAARNSTDIANDAAGQIAPVQQPPPPVQPPAPNPSQLPMAYWKMDQVSGGTIVDSSGHGYDLRLVPSPTLPTLSTTDTPLLTGGNGGSLAFNGSESFAYAWPLTQLATSQQSTLEAWVKFDDLPNLKTAVSVGKLVLVPVGHELSILYPYLAGAGTTGANLQVGQWIHLAVVFDTSQSSNYDRLKAFVNGLQVPLSYSGGPVNVATPTLPSDPVRLGYLPTDNAISLSNFYPLQGKLDEVRIYNVARNSTDIANDAAGQIAPVQQPPPPVQPPAPNPSQLPMAYWKMDQVSGGTIVDSSGHGYDLRLVPSPTLPTLSASDKPTLVGGNASSLAFDGSGSYANASSVTQLANSQQSTLEAWVKFDDLPNLKTAVSVGKLVLVPVGHELSILYPYLAGAGTTGANLQVGQWIHLAVVFDTSQSSNYDRLKAFVNGLQVPLSYSGGPVNVATPTLPSDPVRLGYLPTDNAISLSNFYPLQGKLDEVRIYNVARNSTDIANDAAGQTPQVDTTPPNISATATTAGGKDYVADTWTNQSVTVHFSCSDAGSGIATCPPDQTLTTEGITPSVSGTAIDKAGNRASADFGPINIDKTPPTFTGACPATGPFLQNAQAQSVTFPTSGIDPLISGLNTTASILTLPVNTASVGSKTLPFTAVDNAGNQSTKPCIYPVIPSATIQVFASLHTVGPGTSPDSKKTPLELDLKVFDLTKVSSSSPQDFGTVWDSGPGLAEPLVIESGPTLVNLGGGQANQYTLLVAATDSSNTATSGRYLVIGKATVEGTVVYVGRATASLTPGSTTPMYLQVIKNSNGKKMSAQTTAVPGSMLLIVEPQYLEFTTDTELLPIIYESVDGVWNDVVKADPPEGFVSTPGALTVDVSTSQLEAVQFSIKDVGSSWTQTTITHKLKHNGKDKTLTSSLRMVNKQKGPKAPASPTPKPVTVPAAPTNLTSVASAPGQPLRVTLRWKDSATNETSFTLQRATDGAFTQNLQQYNLPANTVTYPDTRNLAFTLRYYYRIRAYNSAGASAWSSPVNVVMPANALAAPSGLAVTSGTRTSITLTWRDTMANESGFYIERSPNGTTGWTRVGIVKPNVTTFTNRGLAPNTLYYYRVQAYNAGGTSPYSNRVSGKTKP